MRAVGRGGRCRVAGKAAAKCTGSSAIGCVCHGLPGHHRQHQQQVRHTAHSSSWSSCTHGAPPTLMCTATSARASYRARSAVRALGRVLSSSSALRFFHGADHHLDIIIIRHQSAPVASCPLEARHAMHAPVAEAPYAPRASRLPPGSGLPGSRQARARGTSCAVHAIAAVGLPPGAPFTTEPPRMWRCASKHVADMHLPCCCSSQQAPNQTYSQRIPHGSRTVRLLHCNDSPTQMMTLPHRSRQASPRAAAPPASAAAMTRTWVLNPRSTSPSADAVWVAATYGAGGRWREDGFESSCQPAERLLVRNWHGGQGAGRWSEGT